jgi:membrane dipeptidase
MIMMNRRFFLIVSLLFIAMTVAAQRAKKIHFKSILVDTHNDIPETALAKGISFDQSLKGRTHSDLQRMKEGGVDAQFFSIWCDGHEPDPYAMANRQMDTVLAWTNRNPDKMEQAFTAEDIIRISKQKKTGCIVWRRRWSYDRERSE